MHDPSIGDLLVAQDSAGPEKKVSTFLDLGTDVVNSYVVISSMGLLVKVFNLMRSQNSASACGRHAAPSLYIALLHAVLQRAVVSLI